MSHRPRVRMWLEIDGVRRTVEVLESAVGQRSAAGWQIDDTPPPPAPRPTRRRKPKPAPLTATGGAGEPDPTTEQE